MAILNKRISSATLPQLQKDARLGSIIRDVDSAPAVTNDMFRTINPSVSTNQTPSPAYVSQLTSALREMQPQNMTSRIAPTQSNNVSLMSSQMPDMSAVPNISKGPITSITSPGDSPRQKIGSTTTTSGGVSNAVINALAGAVMGLGAQKILAGGNKSGSQTGGNKSSNNSSSSNLPAWAKGNPTITANKDGTYTQKMPDGSTAVLDKDGNIISTTEAPIDDTTVPPDLLPPVAPPPVIPAPIDDYTEYPIIDDTPVGDFKRGGLAVMMKDGGVPHFADAGAVTSTDTTSDPVQSLLDLLKTSGGAAGAGGLLAALLSSTGGNQNTQNTGLDMSTYGLLKPRTTNFGMGPAKYVPFKDYSQRGNYTPNTELLHNLNAPASNPVNEGDYQDPYITNRPGTDNNMAGGTDINTVIAQIVNELKNRKLASQVSQASTTPTASAVSTATPSSGTSSPAGGFAGIQNTPQDPEQYARMVAYNKQQEAAEKAKLDAFRIPPSSRFYQYTQDPKSIPHFYNESDEDALLRVKKNAMEEAEQLAGRNSYSTAYPNAAFITTGGTIRDQNGNEILAGPNDVPGVVMQMKDGTSRYITKAEADQEAKDRQQYMYDQGYLVDPSKPVLSEPTAGNHPPTDYMVDATPRVTELPSGYNPNTVKSNVSNNTGSVDEILKSVGVAGGSTALTPVNFGGIQNEQTPTSNAGLSAVANPKMQSLADFAPDENYYGNYGSKEGGAIHKATGGLTHYTYGKPADVMENLGLREQQMAQGGLPHVSNVPVVEGRMDFRQGSAVHGEGDGQSDDIPAMLADGEYVIDAETVAQIGNGSTKAGAQALDKFRESIRAHKRSAPINKIPPKTKALTSYLKVK